MTKFIAISLQTSGTGKVWSDAVLAIRACLHGAEHTINAEWWVRPSPDRMMRAADHEVLSQVSQTFSEQRTIEHLAGFIEEFWGEHPLLVFESAYEEELLRSLVSRCHRVAITRNSVSLEELIRVHDAVKGHPYPSLLGHSCARNSPPAIAAYAADILEKLGGGK